MHANIVSRNVQFVIYVFCTSDFKKNIVILQCIFFLFMSCPSLEELRKSTKCQFHVASEYGAGCKPLQISSLTKLYYIFHLLKFAYGVSQHVSAVLFNSYRNIQLVNVEFCKNVSPMQLIIARIAVLNISQPWHKKVNLLLEHYTELKHITHHFSNKLLILTTNRKT